MRTSGAAPRRHVLAYVASVSVFSVFFLVLVSLRWAPPNAWELVFFLVLYALADRLEIETDVRGIPMAGLPARAPLLSAGFLVVLVCAFATDPATTAAVGLATALIPFSWRGPLRTAFNAAQTSLYGGAASAAFFAVRGEPGEGAGVALLAALLGAIVAVGFNTTLVGGVLALERRKRIVGVMTELAWPTPNSLAFALLALLVSLLYRDTGAVSVIFILVPLFVLRRARYGKIELDTARERTLLAFVRAVELKSPYTWRHSERVAEIALELHALLGTSERSREERRRAALLHDIGKVAVSGRILDKQGPLDEEEWDEMQRHPATGAMVITDVEFLHDIAPEVLYHHERLDGSGYPSGLTGDDIPFEARVLAVADTFEALTSDRPYRRALSSKDALAEIRRWSGRRLDATVVDALSRLLETTDLGPAVRVPVAKPETTVRSLAREA